ncbi:hypothetical protein F4782DRAFT_522107 [Xylaria castorea]|nr:hypothetical protein F4782DRAFT_522107 [Xylaria castorea]
MFDRMNPQNDVAVKTSGYLAYSGAASKVPAVAQYFMDDQKVKPGDKVFMQMHKISKRRLQGQRQRSIQYRRKLGLEVEEDEPDEPSSASNKVAPPQPLKKQYFGFSLPGSSRWKRWQKKPTEAMVVDVEEEEEIGAAAPSNFAGALNATPAVPDDEDLDNGVNLLNQDEMMDED